MQASVFCDHDFQVLVLCGHSGLPTPCAWSVLDLGFWALSQARWAAQAMLPAPWKLLEGHGRPCTAETVSEIRFICCSPCALDAEMALKVVSSTSL